MSEFMIIHTTCSDADDAKLIANELIDSGLVKCVHIIAVKSLYKWEGETNEETEIRLELKAKSENYAKIETWIKEIHASDTLDAAYQTPEIIAIPIIAASPDYANYLRGEGGD